MLDDALQKLVGVGAVGKRECYGGRVQRVELLAQARDLASAVHEAAVSLVVRHPEHHRHPDASLETSAPQST